MTEQELDLLEIPSGLSAELGAGPAEIMIAAPAMPISLADCSTTDQIAQSLRLPFTFRSL